MPTWPLEAERSRRMHGTKHVPRGRLREVVFGLSLAGNVVLLTSVLGVLALIQMGLYPQGGASGQPSTNFTLRSPSAAMTASPSPSPSPDAAALQVAPSSVRLSCSGDQRTQVVTLQNSGAMTVQWRATFSMQKPGVTISPRQGELAAGDSMAIQVQTTTKSTGPRGGSGRQGMISFASTNLDSGQLAQLSYTTVGCH
jgi:hypothetical protein